MIDFLVIFYHPLLQGLHAGSTTLVDHTSHLWRSRITTDMVGCVYVPTMRAWEAL